jgi:hypothetical protein
MHVHIATWIAAVATVVLAIGAIVTAMYAIKGYRKQSQQTRLFQQQVDGDIAQRRRSQASQVFAWIEPRPFEGNSEDLRLTGCVRNTSQQPVYDISLNLEDKMGGGKPVLLPNEEMSLPGLGLAFAKGESVWARLRDAAGVHWRVDANGQLAETAGKDVSGAPS